MSAITTTEETVTGQCERHGEYTAARCNNGRRWVEPICPTCTSEQEAAEREQKAREQERARLFHIERLFGASGLPLKFRDRTFENYEVETDEQRHAVEICRGFADRFETCLSAGTSLALCGQPGSGKTHLAAAIAGTIMQQGRSVLWYTAFDVIRRIRETWKSSNEHERAVVNSFAIPDLFVMDEVGVQRGTQDEQFLVFDVLNKRYQLGRPNLLMTNCTEKELVVYLGERALDRLSEGGGGIVPFGWPSYRKRVVTNPSLPGVPVQPVQWPKAPATAGAAP